MNTTVSSPRCLWVFVPAVLVSLGMSCLGVPGALVSTPTEGAKILKVEPPNWWAGHSINPVRVLIRGANLAGARVESPNPKLQIGLTRVNEKGTYLFVDVEIDAKTAPGQYPLKIVTDNGSVTAAFEVLSTLPRAGRFRGFSSDDVIYLIMVDRFANGDPSNDDPAVSRGLLNRAKARYYHGGDFQGIIDHLPYLKDLGVTAVWMTPVYDNVNHLNEREKYDNEVITDYHGYGAVDFYGVEEHFGDMTKLRELVDAAHRLGIKVIQDEVANHTGPYHPWVKDSPTPTWYHGTEARHLNETWQTWTLMDRHAPPEETKATLDGWFINILPDLNQNDEEVVRYLIQNTLWWLGMTGFDGIREDTLPYVPRRFWREWMTAIKREYPDVKIVGEVFDADPGLVAFFEGGRERFDGIDSRIDTLFDFPLCYPIRRAFAERKALREIPVMLAHDYLYVDPTTLVTFLGNHDMARFMNEPGAGVAGMQDAFTLLMTSRGTPMIYYGDEIGMHGGPDPDNRRDFPGGWPGDPRNAFDAAGRTPEEQAVFERVRKAARLRAELEPLRRGTMVNLTVSEQSWAYARISGQTVVIMAFNNDQKPALVEFSVSPTGLSDGVTLEDRLGTAPGATVTDGMVRISLAPRSTGIYTVK